ncbi:MAG: glycosyltransferase family 4 protein [Pseudonocardia sp.]
MADRVLTRRTVRDGPAPDGALVYLTNQSPLPPYSGGQMREWQFLRHLADGWDVHLVAVTPHFGRDVQTVDELVRHCRTVALVEADTAGDPALPARVRTHGAPSAIGLVRDLLADEPVDLVHVEGYFLMQHVPVACPVPVLLVEENIEYLIDRQREELVGPQDPSWTLTREIEHAAWRRATRCGVVSRDDLAVLHKDVPALVASYLPSGCDHFGPGSTAVPPDRLPGDAPRVVFTGSSGWGPSRDAAEQLVREIWPLVRQRVPAANLVLAGGGMSPEHLGLPDDDPSIHMVGSMPSLGPLLHAADVFVCPVRFGGGIKSKILESLHAHCAVVSSQVGLQGLTDAQRRAVVVADGVAGTATAIADLLTDPALAARVRSATRDAALSLVTWQEAASLMGRAWAQTAALGRIRSTITA